MPLKVDKIRIGYGYTPHKTFKVIAVMVGGGDTEVQVQPEQKTAFLNRKKDRIVRRSCGDATPS
jgi:hypothetical protein